MKKTYKVVDQNEESGDVTLSSGLSRNAAKHDKSHYDERYGINTVILPEEDYEETIKFNRTVQFLGRNGGFKCTGVSVITTQDNSVMIEPITSKGEIGRSFIEIPIENIEVFINTLKKASKQ